MRIRTESSTHQTGKGLALIALALIASALIVSAVLPTAHAQNVPSTPGETFLKILDIASPQTVFDAVILNAPPLEDGETFMLTAYEIPGPDAAFFDLDLFTAIAIASLAIIGRSSFAILRKRRAGLSPAI